MAVSEKPVRVLAGCAGKRNVNIPPFRSTPPATTYTLCAVAAPLLALLWIRRTCSLTRALASMLSPSPRAASVERSRRARTARAPVLLASVDDEDEDEAIEVDEEGRARRSVRCCRPIMVARGRREGVGKEGSH